MVLMLLLVNRHTTLLLSKSKAKVWSSLHYNDDESIYQLKIEICKCKTCLPVCSFCNLFKNIINNETIKALLDEAGFEFPINYILIGVDNILQINKYLIIKISNYF